MKPILFVFGPSAVGKSFLFDHLKQKQFICIQIDTDSKKRTFKYNGLPEEWDNDHSLADLTYIAKELRRCIKDEHKGVIITFPTTYIYEPPRLAELREHGATPIILWGSLEHCLKAKRYRWEDIKGKKYSDKIEKQFLKKNQSAFEKYRRSEYEEFRIRAFKDNGDWYVGGEYDEWVEEVIAKTINSQV